MSKRPASIASFDSETLDFFDDRNASFRTSKLTAAGAVFGSAPRYRAPTDPAQRTIATQPSPSSRLQRRSSEALPRAIPTTPSRLRSSSAAQVQEKVPERPGSPDIEAILAKTPRPRKTSTVSPPRSLLRSGQRSQSTLSLRLNAKERKSVAEDDESIFSISDYGMLLEEDESQSDEAGGSESDSSIDIHTPLPHLMFRDGLLSPRSKLLPQDSKKPAVYPFKEKADDRSRSVLSIASTVGSFVTKTGMGLTTGLGWSDSEDEDAPSALTRRLITTTIDRKRSATYVVPFYLACAAIQTTSKEELGNTPCLVPIHASQYGAQTTYYAGRSTQGKEQNDFCLLKHQVNSQDTSNTLFRSASRITVASEKYFFGVKQTDSFAKKQSQDGVICFLDGTQHTICTQAKSGFTGFCQYIVADVHRKQQLWLGLLHLHGFSVFGLGSATSASRSEPQLSFAVSRSHCCFGIHFVNFCFSSTCPAPGGGSFRIRASPTYSDIIRATTSPSGAFAHAHAEPHPVVFLYPAITSTASLQVSPTQSSGRCWHDLSLICLTSRLFLNCLLLPCHLALRWLVAFRISTDQSLFAAATSNTYWCAAEAAHRHRDGLQDELIPEFAGSGIGAAHADAGHRAYTCHYVR
ncbi:hypothetical protein EUX98_g2963 [Antrodiella citrinella]|uniref:Uncharacterized protein n=1 Tax=Antrodiella citrinella TaxID=2447956 RepID=A0A4S4MYY6_9APHY|nr:hypothetical protein EUX98_g2963 [Antrodiella citrinella]